MVFTAIRITADICSSQFLLCIDVIEERHSSQEAELSAGMSKLTVTNVWCLLYVTSRKGSNCHLMLSVATTLYFI